MAHGCAFLFVCLPPSHSLLYEWVADFERTGDVPTVVKRRWTGTRRLTDTYRWLNDLPLRDGNDALLVSWCELTTTDANGTVLYRNAWASSERIHAENVIAAGRSRWKIENENNEKDESCEQSEPRLILVVGRARRVGTEPVSQLQNCR